MDDTESRRAVHDRAVVLESAWAYAQYLQEYPCAASLLEARQREIRLAPDDQMYFCTLPENLHMVAVAVPDSPDTIAVLPVLARLARASLRINFWVMDAVPGFEVVQALMGASDAQEDLTEHELPLLAVFDADSQYLGHWGPHPAGFSSHMDAWLRRRSGRKPRGKTGISDRLAEWTASERRELIGEMRLWYNSGLNQSVVAEVRELLESVVEQPVPEDDEEDAGDE